MADPRTCRSFRCNPSPGGENEFIGGLLGASTKDSNTPTPSLTIFQAQTHTPAPTPASLGGTYTNVDLQRATKLALESFVQGQAHT